MLARARLFVDDAEASKSRLAESKRRGGRGLQRSMLAEGLKDKAVAF